MARFMLPECIVCLCPFDDTYHCPRVLNCGHSLCEDCIGSLTNSRVIKSEEFSSSLPTPSEPKRVLIRCPECSARTRLTDAGVQSLPKNIELMRLVGALTTQPSGIDQSQSQSQIRIPELQSTQALTQPQLALRTNTVNVESDSLLDSDDEAAPSASDTCAPSASMSSPHPQLTSTPDALSSVGFDSKAESDSAPEIPGLPSVSRRRGVQTVNHASLEVTSQPCTQLLRVYEGHKDHVSALAIAGKYLCSASFDKSIRLWSLETGSLLHTLSSHSHRITALHPIHPPTPHPSPNPSSEPQWLVSADYGCQVSVWDLGGVSDDADVAPIEVAKWRDHSDWRYFGVLALCGWEGGGGVHGGGGTGWSRRGR